MKIEIITEQEAINKNLLLKIGTGIKIPSAGNNPFYYMGGEDFQTYIRKNEENGEMMIVNRKRSKRLGKMIGSFGDSLKIYNANLEDVSSILKDLEEYK